MNELIVERKKLDNGMTALVREDRSAQVAAVNVWVKTGYFNEPDERTGISHLLEHMFFKGTAARPAGRIQDEVKSVGGYWNAGTIYDHTNYYIVVPAAEISRALDIEADALLNSTFDAAELAKEQEVVIQEILRKYDRPDALVWESMMALAFSRHHLGRWRMGTPEQIRAMGRDVLVGYYNDRYRPENIILAVAGDVDAGKTLDEIERLFGPMPRGELKDFTSPAEPPQRELRYRQATADITQSYLAMGFHAPPALHEDEYAATVLAQLLGGGKSSRLYRALKERSGLVNSISAGYYSLPGVGAFYIDAELDAEKLPEVRKTLFAEIEKIRNRPPRETELEKIKAAAEHDFLSSLEEVGGLSSALAFYEALGDYNLMFRYVDALRAVTPEDVRRAADKYLRPDGCSLAEYRPDGAGDDTSASRVREEITTALENMAGAEDTPPESGTTAPPAAKPARAGEPGMLTLSTGMTVITHPRTRLPLVSIGVYFPGGRTWDTRETAGLTRLALSASMKGSKNRDAEQLQDEAARLGARLASAAGADYASFTLSCLARNLPGALDVLADILLNATFPETEVEKERETQLARILRLRDNTYGFPMMLARRAACGDHPYGIPAAGYEDSVAALTREQLTGRFGDLIRAEGSLVAAAGYFDTEELLALLEEKLAALPAGAGKTPAPDAPAFSPASEIVERNKAQTGQAFAFGALPANSALMPALSVLLNIASGMGGRLYNEVREKRNLAYTVHASMELNLLGGLILNYAATSPENEEKARDLMLEEWKRLAAGDISLEEFEIAVRYTTGIHRIALQANDDFRDTRARNFLVGRGADYHERFPALVRALSIEDVKNAAALLSPDVHSLGVLRAVKN